MCKYLLHGNFWCNYWSMSSSWMIYARKKKPLIVKISTHDIFILHSLYTNDVQFTARKMFFLYSPYDMAVKINIFSMSLQKIKVQIHLEKFGNVANHKSCAYTCVSYGGLQVVLVCIFCDYICVHDFIFECCVSWVRLLQPRRCLDIKHIKLAFINNAVSRHGDV